MLVVPMMMTMMILTCVCITFQLLPQAASNTLQMKGGGVCVCEGNCMMLCCSCGGMYFDRSAAAAAAALASTSQQAAANTCAREQLSICTQLKVKHHAVHVTRRT